jgi:hypothetical protein
MPGIASNPEQGKFHTTMRHFRSPAFDSLPNQASRERRNPLFKNEQFGSQVRLTMVRAGFAAAFRSGAISAAAIRRF